MRFTLTALVLILALPADAEWRQQNRVVVRKRTVTTATYTARPVAQAPAAVPALAAEVSSVTSSSSALAEVNAARARRGLRPYLEDPGLTAAARECAAFRAAHGLRGHAGNDFAFCRYGSMATVTGAGALDPSWGFQSCAMYERHTYAGAGIVQVGGIRFMSLFVR